MQRRSHPQKRRLNTLGGVFLVLSLLAACLPAPITAAPNEQADDAHIDALLAEMSLAEKVGQMFMVSLWGTTLTQDGLNFITAYAPGGVVLFGYNIDTPAQITALTNQIQQTGLANTHGVQTWIATDQEGGTVARLTDGFTTFPVSMVYTAANTPAYVAAVGAAMAEELRAVGINMNLAPVADLETNRYNPIIRRRSFGSDPHLAGAAVSAFIVGMQSGGVMATAKHFPGHGETDTDSHLELPVVNLDRDRLESVELVPFRYAINAGVGAIMAGHLWYPALDPTPDTPASLSPAVLTGLLREEMGYGGLIMTDALDMDAIDANYTPGEAAILAIQAGADLLAPGPHLGINGQRAAIEAVIAAAQDGTIMPETIDAAVRRILHAKADYGLLEAWTPLDPAGAAARINREDHEMLIADVLAAAITLAVDENNAVPIDPARRVALIYPATRPSIARTCEVYDPEMTLIGVSDGPTAEEITWAVSAAASADVTVVFTQDVLDVPDMQALVAALPPERTIVVALRSPYDLDMLPRVSGYITTYTPLDPVIPAVCARLFGAAPITGVLPVAVGDLPAGSGLQRP